MLPESADRETDIRPAGELKQVSARPFVYTKVSEHLKAERIGSGSRIILRTVGKILE